MPVLRRDALRRIHSAGYARPPLGVLADLQSAVKKCPNLFMLWGFAIPSNQAVHSAGYARPPLGVPADMLSAVKKCPNLFMLWGFAIISG